MSRRTAVILLVALLLVAPSLLLAAFREPIPFYLQVQTMLKEIPFNATAYTRVARELLAEHPKQGADGVVTLPPRHASMSRDGKVYVTRKGKDLTLLLFVAWRGKGSNLRGYLLCSRPLKPEEIRKDWYSGTSDAVVVNGPGITGWPVTPRQSGVTNVEVLLERKLERHWYYVSYSLD